jgi:2-oxoisovalerate dehydrogenase E1 component
MLRIRAGDEREERLLRQGRGWIYIPGQGHEGLSVLAEPLEKNDLLFLYYRDRALMQARGISPLEMAREYLATEHATSGGRAMPVHGTARKLGIFPPVTPTGSQCLPAVGAAWGIKLRSESRVVLCTIGDAATRQGEFFEAVAFALQNRLPIVFVVEDNGYGISTSTRDQLPFRIGLFPEAIYQWVDGREVEAIRTVGSAAIAKARRGDGPTLLWIEVDRIQSHTNSDDHRIYRSAAEIALMRERDPIVRYSQLLIDRRELTEVQVSQLRTETRAEVEEAYAIAELEPPPPLESVSHHLLGHSHPAGVRLPFSLGEQGRTMAAALNATLGAALERIPNAIIFGEDVEDPKGGVFGFTKGLSTRFPGRVINSPLAEATIIGSAVGLAAIGFRPIFELQFVDFLAPGFNQLLNQVATVRWRSRGDWTCPTIFYAPYGAYLPAGSTWHSQSNEGIWAHIPGLRLAVPSTPRDLAGLLWTALHEDDPCLLLIPKHIMRVRHPTDKLEPRGFGRARLVREGTDVTVVAWGNCVELVESVAAERASRLSVEVIDPVSLVPCDWTAIETSVAKTGRLVVVNEDARTCSFGQAIITEMISTQERFNRLLSPPLLVAREDLHIPFNPVLENAILPDAARIHTALTDVMR